VTELNVCERIPFRLINCRYEILGKKTNEILTTEILQNKLSLCNAMSAVLEPHQATLIEHHWYPIQF
jgi:hypothetical protein